MTGPQCSPDRGAPASSYFARIGYPLASRGLFWDIFFLLAPPGPRCHGPDRWSVTHGLLSRSKRRILNHHVRRHAMAQKSERAIRKSSRLFCITASYPDSYTIPFSRASGVILLSVLASRSSKMTLPRRVAARPPDHLAPQADQR